jgi:hypothetical protein
VPALAVVGSRRQRLGGFEAAQQLRLESLVERGGEHAGAEGVRHRASGLLGDDRVDVGDRVGLVGVQLHRSGFQAANGGGRGARHGVAPLVGGAHGLDLLAASMRAETCSQSGRGR